jgi:mono/diheme cytochrome c family protein
MHLAVDGMARMRHLWLICTMWVTGCHAVAQDLPGDPAAGASLAREVCAKCHVVAEDQMIDPAVGPSLLEVAEDPATTELSLRAFLQTPHPTMPNLMLTPEETDDIVAYLLSLKGE